MSAIWSSASSKPCRGKCFCCQILYISSSRLRSLTCTAPTHSALHRIGGISITCCQTSFKGSIGAQQLHACLHAWSRYASRQGLRSTVSLGIPHTSWPLPLNCLAKRSGKLQKTSDSASLSCKRTPSGHQRHCNRHNQSLQVSTVLHGARITTPEQRGHIKCGIP